MFSAKYRGLKKNNCIRTFSLLFSAVLSNEIIKYSYQYYFFQNFLRHFTLGGEIIAAK